MSGAESSLLFSGLVLIFGAIGQAIHRDIPAGGCQQAAPNVVTVYLKGANLAPPVVIQEAESVAGRIFSWIGIHLVWRQTREIRRASVCVSPCPQIEIQLDAGTPQVLHPGALAYAAPYASSGTRIYVMWDRLSTPCSRTLWGPALGHVLQGEVRHSAQGLMKAYYWEPFDFHHMTAVPMAFTTADADLIRKGLSERHNTCAESLPPQIPATRHRLAS